MGTRQTFRNKSVDEHLLIASYSVHAIARSINPAPPPPRAPTHPSIPATDAPYRASGIEVLESSQFRLTCFQTVTGTKFLLFTDPNQPNVDSMLQRIYNLYADYVMKNPFYTVEMPIRCEKFDRELDRFLRTFIRG